MTHTEHKEKATVEYSSRRKRSLHRKRLMDIDKSVNPDELPPGTRHRTRRQSMTGDQKTRDGRQ